MTTRTARITTPAAAAAFVVVAALAGCSATTAGAPSSSASASASAPAPASASASAPASASASGSRQAWVRGTKVTLTNGTASEVEVKPWTLSGGAGAFASLAPGASTSATSEWSTATGTETVFYIKRPPGGVVALMVVNPDIGTPATKTCESTVLTGCDDASSFSGELQYDENQTQTTSTQDGAATFTITRNADDDDNKNWTASLDVLS